MSIVDEVTRQRIAPETIAGRLKTWPGDLDDIQLRRKRSEVRRIDDRTFRVGQVWELYAWDPIANVELALPSVLIRITHVGRMAGPLMLCGIARRFLNAIPVAVLSFEIV